MLREATNKVNIEGILSEINIEDGSYKKNGEDVECIRGDVKIRTTQVINGKEIELEIPVYVFSNKYVNKNGQKNLNLAYKAIKKVQEEFVSIAASDIETADRVRITSARLGENAYYNQNGQIISFPHVNATFINKIKKEDCNPKATFLAEGCIIQCRDEVDRNEELTGRYIVTCAIPLYKGKVDKMDFYVAEPQAIEYIKDNWAVGDTVVFKGKLNFSSKIEVIEKSLGFGEPVEEAKTINVSELIITGGDPTPLTDNAFERTEIEQGLLERKQRLEAQRDKNLSKTHSKNAPKEVPHFSEINF